LVRTFEESRDFKSAETLLLQSLKKPQYKKSKKVWMALHRVQLRSGALEAARASLTRSLQSLGTHKHVETLSRFALAEFDFGSQDKARSVFEDLLEHYPKRTDLWHLYVDREIKLGNVAQARQLFERMVSMKSSTRNMKTVFKKYLSLEMRFGNEATQNAVKEKAAAYVSSL
jgi:rRNA biogenesis protein RRP5